MTSEIFTLEPDLGLIQRDWIKEQTHYKIKVYGPNKELLGYKWVPKLDYTPSKSENIQAFISKMMQLSDRKYHGWMSGLMKTYDNRGHFSKKQADSIIKFLMLSSVKLTANNDVLKILVISLEST